MVYYTIMMPKKYKQMSLEDLLFGKVSEPVFANNNKTSTRTYELKKPMDKMLQLYDFSALIEKLTQFNKKYEKLKEVPRAELYETFYIPKRKGGLRRIDAPKDELKDALYELKDIFEFDFGSLYHTNAFAYIKNRSPVDAAKKHQFNESKWFGKYDLTDFFGSTTIDFVIKQLSMIFPFSEILKTKDGRTCMYDALDLAFLNGGLPQGTPFSPFITNVIMIPIDYRLSSDFRSFNKQTFVYTRYADDFQISSKYEFNPYEVEEHISKVLSEFGAPFVIKKKKTRYGSSAGKNWILGVMLNKDNVITVGHKRKKHLQTMLHNYIMDKKNGKEWSREDLQVMEGCRSYCRMIEGSTIDSIIEHINKKHNVDVLSMIKSDLRG